MIEQDISLEGTRTHLIEAGSPDSPPLLLLHDGAVGGAAQVTWGRCLPLLAEHFHVLAPDFVGFGQSDKVTFFDRSPYDARITQVTNLVESWGRDEPVHVVGSSFGGSVALRLLDTMPIALASVTSIGGSGGPWKTPTMAELGRWDGTREDLSRILRFLMNGEDAAFEGQLEERFRSATIPGHYRSLMSAALPLPEALRIPLADEWPSQLEGCTVPTLLVAGSHDNLFEPEWPDRIADVLRDRRVVRTNSLHSPNLDQPELTVSIISDFIRDVRP
jgi:pimeloyl-ACP methyl ester carboxylesterase